MSRPLEFLSISGARIRLGREVGAGGEGRVFEVQGDAASVGKVYHAPVDARKSSKLKAMARGATPDLLKVAAWPTDVLTGPDGRVHGLLMPRIADAREAHSVYSPKQRCREMPQADWKFLIWVARNAAAAVATVHEAGHIVGDINQKGFLVDSRAQVRLIDCDSFQIVSGSERHYCLVGVPEFTAPELLGKPFDRTLRTENHDAFGLSVLIFHLLFMGRHPFAGRFLGSGEMPVERAVRELRFAYSQSAGSFQMTPPPHSLALSATSFGVASLFERAFGSAGVQGARPRALEWVKALETLSQELQTCKADRIHKYHTSLRTCPWCDLEQNGGPAFFVASPDSYAGGRFSIEALLQSLQNSTLPPSLPHAPSIPSPRATGRPIPGAARLRERIAKGLKWTAGTSLLLAVFAGVQWGGGIALGLWVFSLIVSPGTGAAKEMARRKQELDDARRDLRVLVDSWQREGGTALGEFRSRREELAARLEEYTALPSRRSKELQVLERERERFQRQDYLDQFDIETARLSGIGPGIKAQLIAEGFETAADVNESVFRVSGIGPSRYATLSAWRSSHEARFRFDPAKGVSPAQVAAVTHRIQLRQRELELILPKAHREFVLAHRRAASLMAPDPSRFAKAALRLAQAEADARV